MKHHFTVECVVADRGLEASRFLVELDPEQLVARLGVRALRRRRGTAKLHGGAVKVIALVTSRQAEAA